ncbi:MAG: hypothetical protein ACLP1Q_03355 [Solirubrobacteraceae bacterium]
MAAEADCLAIGYFERFGPTRVSTDPDLKGVTAGLDRHLDRLMPVDRSDAAAVDGDLESPASQLNAYALPLQHERC